MRRPKGDVQIISKSNGTRKKKKDNLLSILSIISRFTDERCVCFTICQESNLLHVCLHSFLEARDSSRDLPQKWRAHRAWNNSNSSEFAHGKFYGFSNFSFDTSISQKIFRVLSTRNPQIVTCILIHRLIWDIHINTHSSLNQCDVLQGIRMIDERIEET